MDSLMYYLIISLTLPSNQEQYIGLFLRNGHPGPATPAKITSVTLYFIYSRCLKMVALEYIQNILNAYKPTTQCHCDVKTVLYVYISVDPNPYNWDGITGFWEGISVEILYNTEFLSAQATFFRLPREYIYIYGRKYTKHPNNMRIFLRITSIFYQL